MTNTILSAIMFFQIVTNWGPVENFDKNLTWNPVFGTDPYPNIGRNGPDRRQHANVESQEVVQVTLPDGRVTTNIMKSTTIEEINKTGRRVESIDWYETNVAKVVYANTSNTQTWFCVATNITHLITNSICLYSPTINTSTNILNIDEAAELVSYAKKQKWIRAEPERAGLWTKISGTAGYYWDKMTKKKYSLDEIEMMRFEIEKNPKSEKSKKYQKELEKNLP